jgi:hypothetical protein
LDSYRLVILLGAKNRFGAHYFQVFLRNAGGAVSRKAVILGLFNQGRYPSYNWIEVVRFTTRVSFGLDGQTLDIARGGLDRQLFQGLASLIPPGGHLMVEYDSPEQDDTARSLSLGIPPVATQLGYMMFLVGCGAGFKDWYFSEGGSEGPRKLQGYKALTGKQAQLKVNEIVSELKLFLSRPPSLPDSALEKAARHRARTIIERYGPSSLR